MNSIWLYLILISIVVAAYTGNMDSLTTASFDSARSAVTLAIGLIGAMALWLGIMKVAEAGGLMKMISRAIRPLMIRLFPDVPSDHPAMSAIIMNMAANMLGLGNAATPMGIKAMTELDKLNTEKETASNSMCLFLAINTSSVTVLPLGVIAVRASAGATGPAEILLPAILATLCSTLVAIFMAKLFAKRSPNPKQLTISQIEQENSIETQLDNNTSQPELVKPGPLGTLFAYLTLALFLFSIPFLIYTSKSSPEAIADPDSTHLFYSPNPGLADVNFRILRKDQSNHLGWATHDPVAADSFFIFRRVTPSMVLSFSPTDDTDSATITETSWVQINNQPVTGLDGIFTFEDTAVKNELTYQYQLRSADPQLNGSPLAYAQPIPFNGIPDDSADSLIPFNQTAAGKITQPLIRTAENVNTITWQTIPEQNHQEFFIYRKIKGNDSDKTVEWQRITQSSISEPRESTEEITTYHYDDADIEPNTFYRYALVSYDFTDKNMVGYAEIKTEPREKSFLDHFTSSTAWLIPIIMGGLLLMGYLRGVKVYEVLTDGAKEGFQVAVRIIPFLVAIFVAIGMFRASGALELFTRLLGPLTRLIGMPAEILPMALIRPLSGTGAYGYMAEIVTQAPDSFAAFVASVLQGSTETTFYVLAVYFGSIGIRKTRHALPAALCADAAGVAAALFFSHLLF